MSGALHQTGGGGMASADTLNIQRRQRLRQLAFDTADVNNDPYFMKNHLGSYECRLCLTLHTNEGSYLAHTQGKRHQTNLAKRAARLAKDAAAAITGPPSASAAAKKSANKPAMARIGKPGFRVLKQFDPVKRCYSLLIQLTYPRANEFNIQPRHRFMSSYEQKVEPVDSRYQYLIFAAEPYEVVSIKIPNRPIDRSHGVFFTHWDSEKCVFTMQIVFKPDEIDAQKSSVMSIVQQHQSKEDQESKHNNGFGG